MFGLSATVPTVGTFIIIYNTTLIDCEAGNSHLRQMLRHACQHVSSVNSPFVVRKLTALE